MPKKTIKISRTPPRSPTRSTKLYWVLSCLLNTSQRVIQASQSTSSSPSWGIVGQKFQAPISKNLPEYVGNPRGTRDSWLKIWFSLIQMLPRTCWSLVIRFLEIHFMVERTGFCPFLFVKSIFSVIYTRSTYFPQMNLSILELLSQLIPYSFLELHLLTLTSSLVPPSKVKKLLWSSIFLS